jgi:dTDP-4-amino-4,6-dideoxygalactose transaminase
VGCFSFGSGNNLSAGGGGGLITNDPVVYERASGYGELNHPRRQRRRATTGVGTVHTPAQEFFPYASGNRRMHPLHAVLGLPQIAQLATQTQQRDTNGRYLAGLLDDVAGVVARRQDPFATRAANHMFVLRYDDEAFGGLSRATFVAALKAEGIPCQLGYLRPMHHADLFADKNGELSRVWPRVGGRPDIQYSTVDCPHAERACNDEMITLPTNVLLDSTEGMEQILSAIEKIQAGQNELKD